MDCNKDESLRAKSIAENKFDEKDFAGARKFALKAQKLFPGLDGISQMLSTIDVCMSAENKINGEVDWYSVLGLNPSVDDEAIRKQYRKLALTLHPDKNKSIGADGAFALISEANFILSDKIKRLAYNQRMGFKVLEQKVPMPTSGPSPSSPSPTPESGIFDFSSKSTSKTPKSKKQSKKTAPPDPKPAPSFQRTDTFWTTCNGCKVQYEHLKKHLNCNLLCNICKAPFLASPTPPPQNFPKSTNQVPKRRQQGSSNHDSSQTQGRNMSATQKPVAGQAGPGQSDPSVGAHDKLKRVFPESSPKEESVKRNKLEDYISGFGVNYNVGAGDVGFGNANSSSSGSGSRSSDFPGFSGYSRNYRQPNRTRKLTRLETRNMVMGHARKEIRMKLSAWGPTTNEARGNVGGTSKNEHPEQSHPEKIRNQIELMRVQDLKMPAVLSCGQPLGGLEVSWPCLVLFW